MMTKQERNDLIAAKLNQGMSLSDVQKLLAEEYGQRMTFLELRLLAADLAVDWAKHDKPKPPPAAISTEPAPRLVNADGNAENEDEDEDEDELAQDGEDGEDELAQDGEDGDATRVTLDELPRRGTTVSGAVRFASGIHGEWYMDPKGRLGLQLAEGQEAQPTEEDVQLFQAKLGQLLQKMQDDLMRDAADGKTKVTVSPVIRPGSMFSGEVEYASGARGEWSLDQSGRLGLQPADGSSKPTPRDMQLFQMELQRVLKEKGL